MRRYLLIKLPDYNITIDITPIVIKIVLRNYARIGRSL